MVDQMQTPPEGYGDDEGAIPELKEIFGFQKISDDNDYTRFRSDAPAKECRGHEKHYTSSAACAQRASIMTGLYPAGRASPDGRPVQGPDDVPFLDPAGAPTIGDWFRAAGYSAPTTLANGTFLNRTSQKASNPGVSRIGRSPIPNLTAAPPAIWGCIVT